jgi:hypothetical protein
MDVLKNRNIKIRTGIINYPSSYFYIEYSSIPPQITLSLVG